MRSRGPLVLCLWVAACGSAGLDTLPATHDDFRAIQREEARLEEGRSTASDPARSCPDRCAAAAGACEAAGRVERIAHDTGDLDVRERSRRASLACGQARSHVGAACGCGAP